MDLWTTPPVDASREAQRFVDPRVGRRRLTASVGLATCAVIGSFASLASAGETALVLVVPALFVVAALLPVLAYVRSSRGREGALLAATDLARPLDAMLSVVLILSTAVLAITAAGVVLSAICSGLALGIG